MRKPTYTNFTLGAVLLAFIGWVGMPATAFGDLGYPGDGTKDNQKEATGFLKDSEVDWTPDRPEDSMTGGGGDNTPDRRANSDGTPDRVGGVKDCLLADIALGECDRTPNRDATPDCTNGPGDGQGGNCLNAGDDVPDSLHPDREGDNRPDNVPSAAANFINRPGEGGTDNTPDRTNRDEYISIVGGALTIGDRVGSRDCIPADVLVGECDNNTTNQIDDGYRDRTGRDGTNNDWTLDGSTALGVPDNLAANQDNQKRLGRDNTPDSTPDGPHVGVTREREGVPDGDTLGGNPGADKGDQTPDRVFASNQDRRKDNSPSRYWRNVRSGAEYASGPSDQRKDNREDRGGVNTGVGGGSSGSSGCSFSPVAAGDFRGMALVFLLVAAPLAVVRIRRMTAKK